MTTNFISASNWITFNNAYDWNPFEKDWIASLFAPLREKLEEHQVLNIIRPAHISGEDILEHITFRIFDKYTDVRNVAFVRYTDYHAYLWGDQIEFITQYKRKQLITIEGVDSFEFKNGTLVIRLK